MENNTKSLEDILCKMLPSIVKKDNEWYQDGFLYIRFLNDYIQVKVGKSEYAEKVVNITNDEEWADCIESIKQAHQRAKNKIEWSDEYKLGVQSAEKRFKKQLKDKYNHLNSLLAIEKHIKLTKTLNTEKINKLEIEVNLLKELMNEK